MSGTRTERVTLEVTHQCKCPAAKWVLKIVGMACGDPGESVRVVDEVAFDAVAERDAAIREREEWRRSFVHSEEAGTRLLAERNAALDDADALRARVAELEAAPAASGNGQGILDCSQAASGAANSSAEPKSSKPVAWGVMVNGKIDTHAGSDALFIDKEDADYWCHDAALSNRGTVVPLYTSPPPARGWLMEEERDVISYFREFCQELHERAMANNSPQWGESYARRDSILEKLLARSTLPEVSPPPARGWLTEEDRKALESARLHRANLDGFDEATERECKWASDVFGRLLARDTPPEVDDVKDQIRDPKDTDFHQGQSSGWNSCAALFRKNIVTAGVKVNEVGK